MQRLWARLGDIFGTGFYSSFGDVDSTAMQTWKEALQPFTEEQIARGLKSCSDWQGNFTPTLPQFKELCLTVRHDEKQTWKELPVLKASSEVVQREMERQARIGTDNPPETYDEALRNCWAGR